jgi:hypothetical protein
MAAEKLGANSAAHMPSHPEVSFMTHFKIEKFHCCEILAEPALATADRPPNLRRFLHA